MISMSFLAFACRSLAALSLIHLPSRMRTAGGHRVYAAIVASVVIVATLVHLLGPKAPCLRMNEARVVAFR
jgi:hypothetical protein